MTECSSADFCKLTVQEVADMLLENGSKSVKLYGCADGEMFELCIVMRKDAQMMRYKNEY